MCPTDVCARRPAQPQPARLRSLAGDLGLVAAHQLLPDDLGRRLTPIDRDYEDFGGTENGVRTPRSTGPAVRSRAGEPPIAGSDVFAGRLRDAARFVRSVGPQTGRPPLYVGHFEVPHVPGDCCRPGISIPLRERAFPG